jgi:hypothetical protein
MKPRFAYGIIALSTLVLAPLTATAQVTNGSFEQPVVPVGSFINVPVGSPLIPGWSVVGAPGHVSPISGAFTSFGITFPAQSGAQWLDLTGDLSNSATGVQQTLATLPGSSYTLSFWVGNVVNPGGIYGTTSRVNVLLNGTQTFSALNTLGAGTNTQVWQQFSVSFTASGAATTVAFINGDPSTDNTNGLDNVSLALAGTAPVPEPGTLGLLAGGLAVVGGWMRRRR